MFETYFGNLKDYVVEKKHFHPYPTIRERNLWKHVRKEDKEIIREKAEAYLKTPIQPLQASTYLERYKIGNRKNFEDIYHVRRHRLSMLTLAECIEHRGRYTTAIMDIIWSICEESTWVYPAHLNQVPDTEDCGLHVAGTTYIDLMVAETGALLSWVYYVLQSTLDDESVAVTYRIHDVVNKRVIKPFLERNDYWWMWHEDSKKTAGHHINNWTPWILSNISACIAFMEDDHDKRVSGLEKIMSILTIFINHYDDDGGCDEGPSYWGHAGGSLLDALAIINKVTDGYVNIYHEERIKQIGRFIKAVNIGGNQFVNFADSLPIPSMDYPLVARYGFAIQDDDLMHFGLTLYKRYGYDMTYTRCHLGLRLMAYLFDAYTDKASSDFKFNLTEWFESIQVFIAREHEDQRGLLVAVKGGHNDESHNHNDVGHMIVYANGYPLFIDVGVGVYTSKTFGESRYDIWTMQSAYHNVPIINGRNQQQGASFKASIKDVHINDHVSEFICDISKAYPKEAKVIRWERCIRLDREKHTISIKDDYALEENNGHVTLVFMTLQKPVLLSPGIIAMECQEIRKIEYDPNQLIVEIEEVKLEDMKLVEAWGQMVYRLKLKHISCKRCGTSIVTIK